MKQLFVCEECKRSYDNKDDAIQCEERHIQQRGRIKELESQREDRKKQIRETANKYNELITAYCNDYGSSTLFDGPSFATLYRWLNQ